MFGAGSTTIKTLLNLITHIKTYDSNILPCIFSCLFVFALSDCRQYKVYYSNRNIYHLHFKITKCIVFRILKIKRNFLKQFSTTSSLPILTVLEKETELNPLFQHIAFYSFVFLSSNLLLSLLHLYVCRSVSKMVKGLVYLNFCKKNDIQTTRRGVPGSLTQEQVVQFLKDPNLYEAY